MWKIIALFSILAAAYAVENINSGLINKNVERTIDLNSQLVKISGTITIENTGKQAASSYLLGFERDLPGSVSWVGVQDSQKSPLKISQVAVVGRGKVYA